MKNVSVMIIDDNELDRYILRRFLEKTDVVSDIYEAYGGQDALDKLCKGCTKDGLPSPIPHFLFLDINMPQINGFDFLEKYIQTDLATSTAAPAIFMFSSSASHIDKQQAFAFDCVTDFIEKGNFSVESLNALLLEHKTDLQ